MKPLSPDPAAVVQSEPQRIEFSGSWTALGLGTIERRLDTVRVASHGRAEVSAQGISALDTSGAWLLEKLLRRLQAEGADVQLQGLRPEHARLLDAVSQQVVVPSPPDVPVPAGFKGAVHRVGKSTEAGVEQALALLAFIGESSVALARAGLSPRRLRWRPILFNIRTAGFDALPIVGLLSFLLGIVVAYQGADQLRQYGANIFVADLVGVSMLREFAPLITAIIIAGRSGSAYAAQIGTMAVTEEIDAMRTIGIVPMDLLVLPKVIALVIAMPLLTVFADVAGVLGGMLMARAQLGVGYPNSLSASSRPSACRPTLWVWPKRRCLRPSSRWSAASRAFAPTAGPTVWGARPPAAWSSRSSW